MDPITININLNLPEQQAEWICGAIGCLAQIIDQAARTAGTPFPPAQVNMTQHGDNSTQIAAVQEFRRAATASAAANQSLAECAAAGQTLAQGFAKAQQTAATAEKAKEDPSDPDKPAEPEKPQHTHEDVRNLYIELTHQDKKKEAAEIIRKYASKVPELPETALDPVYAALKKLEGDNGTDAA